MRVSGVHLFRVGVGDAVAADDRRVLQVKLGDDVEPGSLGEREKLGQEEQDFAAKYGVLGPGQATEQVCGKFFKEPLKVDHENTLGQELCTLLRYDGYEDTSSQISY